jgi:ribosomal protein S16
MSKNNSKKLNIIFIIWGLSISLSVICLSIILLLSVKHQSIPSSIIEPQIVIIPQQETESYNRIINKIEQEFNKLTSNPKQETESYNIMIQNEKESNKLISNQKIYYQKDGKTIEYIHEFDPSTGKIIKEIYYQEDGQTIEYINEFDPSTEELIKKIQYYKDGQTISFIEEYDPSTGQPIKEIYYNVDGIIQEVRAY